MFFHVKIFLYSVFFFFIVKLVSSDPVSGAINVTSARGLWFAIILLILLIVLFYQIARRVSHKASMTPMPILFGLSTCGLLYFIQPVTQQYIFMTLSAIAYYFIHISLYRLSSYKKDKTALGIIAGGGIATIFLFYAMSYGIYLNYDIPIWVLMLVLMFVTMFSSFQYFSLISTGKVNVLNYSLVLGLVMAEMVWVLNFWPFGYLTTGVITLIFYYIFWDLVKCHFLDELSQKRVFGNMIFFGILIALVLSTAKWLPVV